MFRDYARQSTYIIVRDGTKLAADIFLPTGPGGVVQGVFPVIWSHRRYHRSFIKDQKLSTIIDRYPWLMALLEKGYVIGVVDMRGSGASFGVRELPFEDTDITDAYDITEWFAVQDWSNGSIGMFGRSYQGVTQLMAASSAPPHLKAIFPEMAPFDLYDAVYSGGIFRAPFAFQWNHTVSTLDEVRTPTPVDEDQHCMYLKQALYDRKNNRDIFELFKNNPFRDSKEDRAGIQFYIKANLNDLVDNIRQSKIGIYHVTGWFDLWSRDTFFWYSNLNNPQKIMIGPWSHSFIDSLTLSTEYIRWFDYWLKGIDNGILQEPPITYFTLGAPKGQEWKTAWEWPIPEAIPTIYFLQEGPSGTVNSCNDGLLTTKFATAGNGHDVYIVDYSTTSGFATRWTNGYDGPFGYADLTPNDSKSLTYTTLPFEDDLEVTGHPIANIYVASNFSDFDFFVFIEDIDQDGYAHYVTEGALKASHRKTTTAPFMNFGLPYHRSFLEDIVHLPKHPVLLQVDFFPISKIFGAGHRLRLTINCADCDNGLTAKEIIPPQITVQRNSDFQSHIILPIIVKDRYKT